MQVVMYEIIPSDILEGQKNKQQLSSTEAEKGMPVRRAQTPASALVLSAVSLRDLQGIWCG